MKRSLLFIVSVLASLTMQAQVSDTGNYDYTPFVENVKTWHVVRTEFGQGCHFEQYTLSNEEVVKGEKTYFSMYQSEDDLTAVYDTGLLREESRKVYFFDADMQKEFLLFDYSLKAGDTYTTFSYDEQKEVTYKVVSVDDYTEGPEVIRYDYTLSADSVTTLHRYLRKWTVCRTDNNSIQKTWIEGVGSLEGPLANLYDARPVSSMSYLAYVEDWENELYLPFSFYERQSRQIHGCNMPTGEADHSDWHHQLTYELEGDLLHVYGKAFTQCGPNNYAYFIEEKTNDPLVCKLHYTIKAAEPVATCAFLHATNFYIPGFDPNMTYIIVDNQGTEHPVINKMPQTAYRPMIEEGKVWKLGAVNSGNPVQWVEYYYFDGDTIIDGKTCKQMMRERFVSPDFAETYSISQDYTISYEGAWYEGNKKVYLYNAADRQFKLMYDFSLNENDTLLIDSQPYVIGPKQTEGIRGFKGAYRAVFPCSEKGSIRSDIWFARWLEGVGSIDGPTINVINRELADPAWFLMSCTVGDEVIYLNDAFEDGATPEVLESRKNRFDFTHTIKTRPKSPVRREPGSPLYGEYSDLQLGINLDPLDDTYLVRIADEAGKAVYEKAVNAGNIIALNIDISAYTKGQYTVIVENSQEAFTGRFEVQTTGIEEVRSNRSEASGHIYNLQGQRLGFLQKGLNIVNGRKIYVK